MDCNEEICQETGIPNIVFSGKQEIHCPPDKAKIGICGWNLLHTIAAHYPDDPTEDWKDKHKRFYYAFSKVYPCKSCAIHFNQQIKKHPPELDNRKSVSLWTCKMHNKVNKYLNKEIFPCNLENLDKRWRKGDPPCTSSINNV